MNELEIRPARPEEAQTVMRLYREAQEWLSTRGTDQWQAREGDAKSLLDRVRANIDCSIVRGECYLALHNGIVVGTITVDEHADPDFWQPQDDPDSALYAHRMIVARSAAGRGFGALLLEWATQLAASRGKRWLRCDAWSTNTDLHAYYVSHGFSHVRTLKFGHRGSGALFQKAALSPNASSAKADMRAVDRKRH